ncbi:MAG: dTMP kinase [Clostridiales bacterium]|nr:dTMP kinase [Clostridiales bacterium]
MEKGIFITFEGGEGSGKSTLIDKTYKWLEDNNISCIKTREPGGIKISEDIRNIILDSNNTSMDGITEALLYAAARRQHIVEKVIPALKDGKVVLCDRFIDSSLAYQGYARGLGIDKILELNKFAIGDYMPSLTLFLDIDPKIGLERINKDKCREVNRLDLEKIDFHNKVREGYEIVYNNNKNRIKKIDVNRSIDEVFNEVIKILKDYIM